jgi:hypothetical protein
MVSYYSVVQYVPDPIANERINIGVVAFGDGMILSRFSETWERRARRFGHEKDLSYVRDFVDHIQSADRTQFLNVWGEQRVSETEIRRIAEEWRGSLQLTVPRASTESPALLLEGVASKFLRGRATVAPYRSRMQGMHLAAHALRMAVDAVTGQKDEAAHLVHRYVPINGELDHHQLDVGIKNGALLHGTWAISFDINDHIKVEHDIKRTAWSVADVRKVEARVPLSIFMLLSQSHSDAKQLRDAKKMFRGLDAEVVEEDSVLDWAKTIAERVVPSAMRKASE